jgi:hypothetical protein
MKVWKVIKERRDRKLAALQEEEQRRDQADEDLGRRLEEGNGRDRAVWEAVYGDPDRSKQEAESGLETDTSASTRKGSLSVIGIREVRNSGSENIEMSNLGGLTGSSRQRSLDGKPGDDPPQVTVHVGAEDEFRGMYAPGDSHTADVAKHESRSPIGISIVEPAGNTTHFDSPAESASNPGISLPQKTPYSRGPQIIPLPFRVPDVDLESRDDASSIATFAASDHIPVENSQSFRGASIHLQRESRNISEEALIIPHVDDDGASSVAATIDGVPTDDGFDDEDESGNAKSLNSTKNRLENLSKPARASQGSSWKGLSGLGELRALTSDGRAPVAALRDPQSLESLGEARSVREKEAGTVVRDHERLDGNDPSCKKSEVSDVPETRGEPPNLRENLPAGTSKVVMAYRTNEWAKHLEAAESPELDDLTPGNGSPVLDSTARMEPAAPVHVMDLQQTALTAEPAAIPSDRRQTPLVDRSLSSTSRDSLINKNPHEAANARHRSSLTTAERSSSQLSLHNIQSRKESPNSTQLKLSSSQTSLTASRGHRSSSTPLMNSQLAGSPIAEGMEASFPPRFTPSPMNLMSQRDSMVRNKPSSTSLNRLTASQFPTMASSPSNEHLPSQDLSALEEDNIPLSQRKSLLQLQHQQQSSRSSLALHQPQRSFSNPRASTLSAWRSSLRAELPAQQAAHEKLESRRTEMINEKRRRSSSQQWAQLEAGRRESDIDRSMRRGDLLDLHREAMRKMQGVANRNL